MEVVLVCGVVVLMMLAVVVVSHKRLCDGRDPCAVVAAADCQR